MSRRLVWSLIVARLVIAAPLTAQSNPGPAVKALDSMAVAAFQRGTPQDLRRAMELFGQLAVIHRKEGRPLDESDMFANLAVIYTQLGRFDSAHTSYQHALRVSRTAGASHHEALTLLEMGRFQFDRLGDEKLALTSFHRALELNRVRLEPALQWELLNTIGLIHSNRGQGDTSLAYLRAALPFARLAKNARGEATTLNSIGGLFLASDIGALDSAPAYLRSALAVARPVKDRWAERGSLSLLARYFNKIGQADSAIAHARAAVPLAVRGDPGELGVVFRELGAAFRFVGRFDSALAYYRAALVDDRRARVRRTEAATLNNIAATFYQSGRPDSALPYFTSALDICRRIEDRVCQSSVLTGIGIAHMDLDDIDSSLAYHAAALPLAIEDQMGILHRNIGSAHFRLARWDSAQTHFRAALRLSRNRGDRSHEATTHASFGLLYYVSPTLRNHEQAAAYFDSASAIYATLRRSAGDDINRISYSERQNVLVTFWPLAWLARGDDTGERAALAAVERNRAQSLLDLITSVPPASAGAGSRSGNTAANLAAEADSLLLPLRRSRTALASYLLARDTLITWVLLPSGDLRVIRTPLAPDSLTRLIRRLGQSLGDNLARSALGHDELEPVSQRGSSASSGTASWEAVLRPLGRLLLPEALLTSLESASELVIIPHGIISLVPFAALHRPGDSKPLGVRFALRYAPSLRALAIAEARGNEVAGRGRNAESGSRPLIAANPVMPFIGHEAGNAVRLPSLPGAASEGRQAASLLGSTTLEGNAASETAIRQGMPSANVIHLATHGLAYGGEATVRNSYVALAPDSTHDGFLRISELLDDPKLSLRADLVVLSACQTGLGNLTSSEGTVGFQRAFLARGARSVLVTLWSVDDQATALLMQRFYRHWLTDRDRPWKAEALRRAQADLRGTKGYDHPRYWAAFQLVGAR